MVKNYTFLKLFLLVFFVPTYFHAQTILYSENFETCSENYIRSASPLCGWVENVITASDNSWAVSNNSPISGSYSLTIGDWWSTTYYDYYTGDNCNKIAYENTKVNAVGYTSLLLSFKWRSNGEATYDYGKVVYSFDGITWTDVVATQYQGQATTQSVVGLAMPAALNNTSFYLGFRWVNDGSAGSDPPFAVDDISVYVACSTVAGTSSSSITQSCAATNTTLSLAGEGAGTIQWQSSTDGGSTWTNIAGATTDPYVHNTAVSRLYRAAVTNGCTTYSSTSSLTISCDITHPASGFASSTIVCGSSYTYRDPGGAGNYGNNQNGLITICPSTAGQYVNVNFTSFNIENGYDYMIVFDGGNGGAPILGTYTNTQLNGVAVRATNSNSSGCLSFRFYSDGATTSTGWQATVTCNATPSGTVPTQNPEDCQGAIAICNDGTFTGGTNNYGFDELPDQWNSCLGNPGTRGEYESTWAAFSPATSGTIAFSITPNSACDYDWAIWGPYTSLQCPAFTNDVPIRCSSTSLVNTGNPGTTGLIAPAVDVIEQNGEYGGGASENGKLAPLNVIAGQVYVVMLDNWSASVTPFVLDWTLTNGATLDCTPPLPVTMASFNHTCEDGKTQLNWTTESERNNDYFSIQKSDEKFQFYEIGRVYGNGNSNVTLNYSFTDPFFNNSTTYYRIKQVDYNGEFMYHRIIASNCYRTEFEVVSQSLEANHLNMIINSIQEEKIKLQLFDISGKLISEKVQELNLGNNKLFIDDFTINSGIYMINMIGEFHHYQSKIIRK